MDINHIILTRFDVRMPTDPEQVTHDIDWYNERFRYWNYVYRPSMAQSRAHATYVMLISPDCPPHMVEAFKAAGMEVFVEGAGQPFRNSLFPARRTLTTRLDSDDRVSPDAFSRLQEWAQTAEPESVYVFGSGYKLYNNRVYKYENPKIGFLSYLTDTENNVFSIGSHNSIQEGIQVTVDHEPSFLYSIHENSDSAEKRGIESQLPNESDLVTEPPSWCMVDTESRYTKPRHDCLSPEYWHSADPDSTEYEVTELVAAFVRATQPELVVETGTAHGQTAEAIGKALLANGHGRLVTMEVDEDRCAEARQRCDGLPVEVLCMSSVDYEPTEPIGFLWLDSLFELRMPEFQRYLPYLVDGAVIGIHDTGSHRPNFMQGIEDYTSVMTLPTPRGVTFAQLNRTDK